MSGTASASIVGVKRCSSPRVAATGCDSGKRDPVQELERVFAHDDDELRLDDPQLAREPIAREPEVAAGELDRVRAVDLHRVDVQALQRLDQRIAGTTVEGDTLLELLRLRPELQQEDVRQRVPCGQRGRSPIRGLRNLVRQAIDLGDRLAEVALVDLICGHGRGHGGTGTFRL